VLISRSTVEAMVGGGGSDDGTSGTLAARTLPVPGAQAAQIKMSIENKNKTRIGFISVTPFNAMCHS